MKKRIIAALLAASALCMPATPTPVQAHQAIFPNTGYSWVGDTMPLYDGDTFRIFYLEDLRDGDIGFHPWSLFTTKDFTNFKHNTKVIPYDNYEFAKDNALGTGSVVKDKDGLYHAFYTGFNWRSIPKETIMHATSTDMVNWTKIPEDSFRGDKSTYIIDDTFRDPNVFYNEDYGEYWMLITTRSHKARGVIGLYTSKDLKTWENQGILFDNDMNSDCNMECPTLIKKGDYWYLTFSDQWPDRVVHYRIAKDSKGPFEKPERDYFDANEFYAGKLAQDDKNIYLVGWTPSKPDKDDKKWTDWAGNMVAHQLNQNPDGTLYPVPIDTVVEKLSKQKTIQPVSSTDGVTINGDNYTFSGDGLQSVVMPAIDEATKITGHFTVQEGQGVFGMMFNVGPEQTGTLNLVFDPQNKEVAFYNNDTARIGTKKKVKKEVAVPVEMKAGNSYDFTLLLDESVAVLYINDQMALSTRMYGMPDHQWGVFSTNAAVTLSNLQQSNFKLY